MTAFMTFAEPIPEDPESILDLLKYIAECNAHAVFEVEDSPTHWPNLFYPSITNCVLCNQELASPTFPPGSNGKCYLLTKVQLRPITAKITCTNKHCLARYNYSTWKNGNNPNTNVFSHAFVLCHNLIFCIYIVGVFNVSNKLFTLDILYDMRNHVEKGEPPGNSTNAIIRSCCLSGSKIQLSREDLRYLEQKLYNGYFAFKAMTGRDWNETICGICGVAPVFESGDGNCKNCTPIKKSQV